MCLVWVAAVRKVSRRRAQWPLLAAPPWGLKISHGSVEQHLTLHHRGVPLFRQDPYPFALSSCLSEPVGLEHLRSVV